MKRIWAQCVKELAQFRRDRLTVALAFLLPLLTLLIFGYAIRLESKNIPLAIEDLDRSPLSRSYIERLFATNQFEPAALPRLNNRRDPAQVAIDKGLAKAALVIPPDFSRRIKSGQPSTVQVLVDGTDVNNARVIKNSIQATTNFFLRTTDLQPTFQQFAAGNRERSQSSVNNSNRSHSPNQPSLSNSSRDSEAQSSPNPLGARSNQTPTVPGSLGLDQSNQTSLDLSPDLSEGTQVPSSRRFSSAPQNQSNSIPSSSSSNSGPTNSPMAARGNPRVVVHSRIWFNPGRKESLYIVPGVFAVIFWIYPSMLAALAMVREKEQGTILQVYASSLSARELLLGKGLAYFLVGLSEVVLIMTLGALLFGLWFAGDPTPLLIGTPIFLAASILFGLFVGVRASTQSAAVQGVATIGFLTALLLSGFIYPLSNIPFPLSLVSNIVPARYYIVITRDAFVRGAGWPGVWFAPLAIAGLGLLLFMAAWRGLRRMQLPD